jgi:hypothetical protein
MYHVDDGDAQGSCGESNEQATREVYSSSRKKTFPCIVLGYVYMMLIPCCLFPFFSVK